MEDLFTKPQHSGPHHVLHFDGSCNPNPGMMGIGFTIHGPAGDLVAEGSEMIGQGTNNIAEYSALIAGLKAALALNIPHLRVVGDSTNVVDAVEGRGMRIGKRHPNMQPLLREAWALSNRFASFSIEHVRRELNQHADRLSTQKQSVWL